MTIHVTTTVVRAVKDALLDAFPDCKSAHLSEVVAALFGYRTAKSFKDQVAKQPFDTSFENGEAENRARELMGEGAPGADIVRVARAAAISANIEASTARRKAAAVADRERMAAAAVRQVPVGRYDDLNGQMIAFVVATKRGAYKPFIGRIMSSPGDQDALIYVLGDQPPQETMGEALAFFIPDRKKFAMVLEHPVPSGGMMGHWLNHMLAYQERGWHTFQDLTLLSLMGFLDSRGSNLEVAEVVDNGRGHPMVCGFRDRDTKEYLDVTLHNRGDGTAELRDREGGLAFAVGTHDAWLLARFLAARVAEQRKAVAVSGPSP